MAWTTWTELQFAAIRFHLIVIGEAASHLTPAVRDDDVVWNAYVDLRHRVAHEYFRVEREHVVELVGVELNRLSALCDHLVTGD